MRSEGSNPSVDTAGSIPVKATRASADASCGSPGFSARRPPSVSERVPKRLLVPVIARTVIGPDGRDTMTRFLESDVTEKARRFGVRIERVGVKDVVLPGEMKTLLNKVIEAEKEAAANVILRREETAATRSLANTAKLMAEQPLLLRLKEIDALTEMAGKVREVRLVVGTQAGLNWARQLVPSGFLSEETGAEHETS